ncbi:hypothetical protein CKO32_11840 [Afifella marina DSM 2698]|nr:hypothetical protein [Afifella marina DSM 2698]MBK1627994.1 hypothetical protein [Afifella marina]MBK5918188.1 hypothetical protein [Afifella marina]RAI19231.1 hypothetical protein CH311_13055 [Afifella marina DSM 2698]
MALAGLLAFAAIPSVATAQSFGNPDRPRIPRVEVPKLKAPDPINNPYDQPRLRQRQLENQRIFAPPGCAGSLTAQQRARCRAKYQYREEN